MSEKGGVSMIKFKVKVMLAMRDMTQKELAEATGLNLRTLQHYEQGSKDLNMAAAVTVYGIATALGVRIEDLLDITTE